MGKILTLVLALLAPSLALAEPFKDQRGNWWDLPMPPAHYFERGLISRPEIHYMSEDEISEICTDAVGKAEPFGCTFPNYDQCDVYISQDLPAKFRKAVERHELAHCHGWGADHPEK